MGTHASGRSGRHRINATVAGVFDMVARPLQRTQRPPREISNPLISAVQISLKALNESLLFTWRLYTRGEYVPQLVALAGVDIFSQLGPAPNDRRLPACTPRPLTASHFGQEMPVWDLLVTGGVHAGRVLRPRRHPPACRSAAQQMPAPASHTG